MKMYSNLPIGLHDITEAKKRLSLNLKICNVQAPLKFVVPLTNSVH